MKLYHGSNIFIDSIDLTKGHWGKDFGKGFYLSADKDQAQKMAEVTTFRNSQGSPTITTFEIDEAIFSSSNLKIKRFDEYTEEWAKFVVSNRRNDIGVQIHDYDIVIGPIANDKVGVQMRLYIEKYIDVSELVKRLRYTHPTFQYFFATPSSIQYLKRV